MSIWGTPLVLNTKEPSPDYSQIYIEQGNISSSTGQDSTSSQSSRLRTHSYIPIRDGFRYEFNCNLARVYVYYYAAEYAFMSGQSSGWLTPLPVTVTPPTGAKYMRIVISKTSGSITPSSVTSFTVDEKKLIIDLP